MSIAGTATSSWTWVVVPPAPGARCARCKESLWHFSDLVSWRGQEWHTPCLLDALTAAAPDPLEQTHEIPAAGMWGLIRP